MSENGFDPVWESICAAAGRNAAIEPLLAGLLHGTILDHDSLESSLSFHLANKLAGTGGMYTITVMDLTGLMAQAMDDDASIGVALRADLQAFVDRDPACPGYLTPLLYAKGFHALQTHRTAHWLWTQGRKSLARAIQNRVSELFGVDIHPAARVGKGILIDHATGIVIGETAVVADEVSILHEVTLGGTGKTCGDRHPKIGKGVLIGAGAKLLGNITVGEGAKIGAGSVVLEDVAPHCTVAGVPAVVIGRPKADHPSLMMDHRLGGGPEDGSAG
jgi:serine O-acetyltransferase